MKKKLVISLALATTVIVSATAGAFAAAKINLIVNGKLSNAETKVIDGTTYVPLRAAAELLGAEVKYDASTRSVTITSEGSSSQPNSNSKAMSFNVDVAINSGPMTMKISKITLDPAYKSSEYSSPINAVVFDVSVENTSDDEILWFFDMGQIVTNTKEQVNGSSDISGIFKGKVVKSGKITFEMKGDVSSVTSLNYFVDRAAKSLSDGGYEYFGEDLKTEIILK